MDKYHQTPHAAFMWDTDKAESNRRKHCVNFEQATQVFTDPNAIVGYDNAHSEHEDRFHLLGLVRGVLLLLVVFTENGCIRIISARKATRQEEKRYAKQ